MKWLIIAWDQIRLNKKVSGILISLIALSIFLVGVIAFYNNTKTSHTQNGISTMKIQQYRQQNSSLIQYC